ncbi:hypothetical protein H920_01335 [Fukomys damarensis]|uniref:Uncharacterized protein n=1 Tax=Fukomys damarensis TaxID=885580 RepID=A0A091DYT1_FUKDA|nr:hypothetical protein H920_01335 [Fukomys damarensis]
MRVLPRARSPLRQMLLGLRGSLVQIREQDARNTTSNVSYTFQFLGRAGAQQRRQTSR